MVNISKVILGASWFILGMVTLTMSYWIFPILIDLIPDSELRGVSYLSVLFMVVFLALILPVYLVISGMKET